MDSWERALAIFLRDWQTRTDVAGALVCGSFVTVGPTKHSDIDVHVVLADGTEWRERGNRVVDGLLVEYFANPPDQIRKYFQTDHADNNASAATQFATGRAVFEKDGIVTRLRAEAAEWLRKPFAPVGDASIELSKYGLWDNLDNLQAAFEQKAPDFAHVYHHTLHRLYQSYARFLRQPVLAFSQVYVCLSCPDLARAKYLIEPFPDGDFVGLFLPAVVETDSTQMLRHAEILTSYVLDRLGGFDVDGWRFRSPVGC